MFKSIIILIGIMSAVVAYSGHETGNGGSFKDFYFDNAWFVEDRPVQYCIKRSKKFVVDIEDVQAATKRSLDKWIELSKKLTIKDSQYRIQKSFIYNEKCTKKIDLVFYFGGKPRKISKVINKNDRVVAFAYPVETNKTKTWSKGFIYIKDSNITQSDQGICDINNPNCIDDDSDEIDDDEKVYVADWTYANNLDAILLHEIGHIFGVSHIPQTIMRESIALELVMEDELALERKYKTEIDHQYSLTPNKLTDEITVETNGVTSIFNLKAENLYTLKKQNGGNVEFYEFIPSSRNETLSILSAFMASTNYIFKRVVKSDDNKSMNLLFGDFFENFVENGTIKFDGKLFPGMYFKNMGDITHQMKIFRNGTWEELFSYSK